MKYLFFSFICVMLSGCCNSPPTTTLVTEKDGCKLYMYSQCNEYPVYFSTCGETSTTECHTEGKVTKCRPVTVSGKQTSK